MRWRSSTLPAPSPSAVARARAVWAGPAARRALAAGERGSVEIALPPGGYVRLSGGPPGWLLVATARAPRGPLTLAVAGLEQGRLSPGAPARVERGADGTGVGGALVVGSLRIALDGIAAGSTASTAPAPAVRPGWRRALVAALAEHSRPPAELADGLAALRRGALDEAVARLAGRGAGLTPAGDDVLAGFAAWREAAGLAERAAERASPIGLAYLRCAERGELPEPADRTLRAIRAGDAGLARLRSRSLSRWGASSGAAILWGIAAAAGARP
jgi:Protein of unknown function (DUF2877)